MTAEDVTPSDVFRLIDRLRSYAAHKGNRKNAPVSSQLMVQAAEALSRLTAQQPTLTEEERKALIPLARVADWGGLHDHDSDQLPVRVEVTYPRGKRVSTLTAKSLRVFSELFDRLTNSRPSLGVQAISGDLGNAGQTEGSAQAAPSQSNDVIADNLHGKWSEIVSRYGVHNGLYDLFSTALRHIRTQQAAPSPTAQQPLAPTRAQVVHLLEVLSREGVDNNGGDYLRGKMADAILALFNNAGSVK